MADTNTEERIAKENANANELLGDDPNLPLDDAGERKPEGKKPEEEKKEEPKEPRVRGIDEKRANIYKQARRAREDNDALSDMSDERERAYFGNDVETRADREARRQAEANGKAADSENDVQDGSKPRVDASQQPGPRHKLTVNGREVELDEKEVIAAAQKAIAADDIIEHAKSLRGEQLSILAELRALRENQPQSSDQPKPSPKPQPDTKVDDDELDSIIDNIQVGDAKDAKAALEKYGERIEKRILDRVGNLDDTIDKHLHIVEEINRRRSDTINTLNEFGRDYPEFKEKPALQAALAFEAADTMRKHMFAAGVQQETLDLLKDRNGMNDLEVAGFAYRKLQEMGTQLPSHVDVLKSSGDSLRKQFGLKAPERQQQQDNRQDSNFDANARLERKRTLTPQPRRATVSPQADKSELSRDENRRQVILQMKAQRRGR